MLSICYSNWAGLMILGWNSDGFALWNSYPHGGQRAAAPPPVAKVRTLFLPSRHSRQRTSSLADGSGAGRPERLRRVSNTNLAAKLAPNSLRQSQTFFRAPIAH
jgi:hypothetical protein